MPDKTQINLERIRACDAEWEESKHPRSENGQFTSGSGAHVSKIQSGGKAKVQQRPKIQAMRQLAQAAAAKPAPAKATLEKARPGIRQMRADKLGYKKLTGEKASNHPEGEAHNMMVGAMESAGGDFYTAKNKLLNNPRISQEVKNAVKKMKAPAGAKPQSMDGLVQHYIDKGDNDRASIAIQLRMEMMDGHDFRGAVHNLLSKYDEAEDKGWMDRESYDKNVDMLLNEVSGDAYSALNPAKPAPAPASKTKATAPKPQPKAAKNNGGLESYKYKPPSKLEGFPIVMASKKTNSGLGGGNRFKFGFKKYKDGIMIRYVDDYWGSSDYAFVPLKNPTLENAYSYSDNASSKTVSALKDSLVTNEELGKIARQLK